MDPTNLARLPIGQFNQVGIVVRDLHAAMAQYVEQMGLGPWRVYTFAIPPVKEMTYRGKPASFKIRVAFAMLGPLQVELIEPITGPNIYEEFFVQKPEGGLHHIGIWVPNLETAVAQARAAGVEVIQSGRGYGVGGDGGFAYLDTEQKLGVIYELIELPGERRPPDEIFPG